MTIPLPNDPGLAAFGSSLTAISLAELGDKTFFMALILAARHRRRDVFLGAFAALTAVTLISLAVGYGLRELLPTAVVPGLAAALFLGFGVKLLVDAQGMADDEAQDEEKEAVRCWLAASFPGAAAADPCHPSPGPSLRTREELMARGDASTTRRLKSLSHCSSCG